jgi:sugar phosphate isomerase/epimerase
VTKQAAFAEIGRGNLEFPAIIAAAQAGGCQWFIVEQDTCPGDPFDSLQISFDYIQSHLVS